MDASTTKRTGREPPTRIRLKVDDAYTNLDSGAVQTWQRAFESLGAECGIHGTDEWGRDDLDVDICAAFGGCEPYIPKPYNFNVQISSGSAKGEQRAGFQLRMKGTASSERRDVDRIAGEIMSAYREWSSRRRTPSARTLDTWFENAPTPKVSILIATFNRRAFIRRTLVSVMEQRYSNWEIQLVNDGGPSVRDIVAELRDERIHLVENSENRGKCYCLNQAYRASDGEFLAYLDDDDIWYPDHLQRLLLPLLTLPVEMAYSDAEEVTVSLDDAGEIVELDRKTELKIQTNLNRLLSVNEIRGISYAHSRRLFDVCEGFDEALRVLDDWDMLRRLAMHSYPYHVSYTTARFDRRVGDLGREMPHMTHRSLTQTIGYFGDRKRIVDKEPVGPLSDSQWKVLEQMRKLAAADLLAAEGQVCEENGDVDGAIECYQRALDTLASHALSARFLGILYLKRGRTKDATALFELCIDSDSPEISDYLHGVLAAMGTGRPKKAVQIAKRLRSSGLSLNASVSAMLDKYEATASAALRGK